LDAIVRGHERRQHDDKRRMVIAIRAAFGNAAEIVGPRPKWITTSTFDGGADDRMAPGDTKFTGDVATALRRDDED
jgi:hypothetical protein